ncbi:carboxymuconolactone decarboxylase family protein [Rhizobium leguminosarum]|uniref:carboxymuconolactone decarboxylase family protein n=1 Tax=Rhizobium leguminosarum TaxID=384 RepID=UPI001D2B630A|nr:carboxymuconolactone decarboxylase family protein [Rhizobium leguminosarum]MBY5571615.1 carboxymuconolactone decarboxylase family protein [Rhizobium leguminosarum]MBY5578669.1 carboxymuconolactone decarboxylase family protein [Rhizobium leguminosarum]
MNISNRTESSCPPMTDEEWPVEIADMKEGFAGSLNVYRTMARHPALLKAWAPLREHIVKDSALGPLRSELVILRAAHRMGSAYEWTHHVSRARGLGISDARIRDMRGTPVGEDGLIARAVDALFDDARLSTEIEQAISSSMGTKAVLDLIATVGFYSVLGCILMTFDTPIDEHVAHEMAKRPI